MRGGPGGETVCVVRALICSERAVSDQRKSLTHEGTREPRKARGSRSSRFVVNGRKQMQVNFLPLR